MDNNEGHPCVYEAGPVTCPEGLCFRCEIPARGEMLHLLRRTMMQSKREAGGYESPGPQTMLSEILEG
ncbi:hypothetical protein LCGC14_0481160 [marine sediment metagenome]|uniref:Uncharacterized protein n=1 Tax=marine sediment metagenome TaxID=412755 RepID=A0A0F9SSK1_9ZZZZ